MEFLARVQTVWDDIKVLDARVGEYVLIARKRGDVWYVDALADWTPRDLCLPALTESLFKVG